MASETLRYAAFTVNGEGGNPSGVVLDASDLGAPAMQAIAAEVGYSETAFLVPRIDEPDSYDVRYFAPLQEVPFCGHATIASAVALAERAAATTVRFHTPSGLVPVAIENVDGVITAELTSVPPRITAPDAELLSSTLAALRWSMEDLDQGYPPALAYAGAEHLVLVTRTRQRLADLQYDFDELARIMQRSRLVTVQLIWPESRTRYHSRNPFAGSGVVEDPATGAAAAAFGGYLRELGKIAPTDEFTISQGVDMGRPSLINVRVSAGEPGVRVRGTANPIRASLPATS